MTGQGGVRRLWEEVGAFAACVFLAACVTFPWVLHLTDHLPMGQYGLLFADRFLALWALWVGRAAQSAAEFFPFSGTDVIFYPLGVRAPYFLQTLWGVGLAWPFRGLLSVLTTHNLLVLLSLGALGYTTYLVGRRLTGDGAAALCGGVAVLASPFVLMEADHHFFVVTAAPWGPLFILALLRLWEAPSARRAVALAGTFAATLIAPWYLSAFLVLFLALFLGVEGLAEPRRLLRGRFPRNLVLALALMGLATTAALLPNVLADRRTGDLVRTSLEEARQFSADLDSFFVPNSQAFFFGLGPELPARPERFSRRLNLFLGYTVLALAAVAWRVWGFRRLRLWILSGGLFLLLSLGPVLRVRGASLGVLLGLGRDIPLPFALLHRLPFFDGIRGVPIFALMTSVAAGVLAAYGVAALRGRLRPPAARWVFPLVLAAVLLEFSRAFNFDLERVVVPEAYAAIAREPRPVAVLELPYHLPITTYQFYQTAHGKKILNGVVPRQPGPLIRFGNDFVPLSLLRSPGALMGPSPPEAGPGEWAAFLRFFQVGFIVLHRDYYLVLERRGDLPAGSLRAIEALLARIGRAEWTDAGRTLLYRFQPEPRDAGTAPPSFRVDFDGLARTPVLLDGWSFTEPWGAVRGAWSQGTTSTLWTFLPPEGEIHLTFRARAYPFPDPRDRTVAVALNGHEAGRVEVASEEWRTYAVPFARTFAVPGVNRLAFRYARTARIPLGPDPRGPARAVAVAFHRIELRAGAPGRLG